MRAGFLGILGIGGLAFWMAAACSASDDSTFTDDDGEGGGTTVASGGGTNTSTGVGGEFSTGQGGGGPGCTDDDPSTDYDEDGFTEDQGDCNDCDANVNPGAIEVDTPMGGGSGGGGGGAPPEPADEDCDGMIDEPATVCDTGLSLEDTDPSNGAKAIDLCETATPNDAKWGVLDASYVRADGTPTTAPGPTVGLLDGFGPNVSPQGGNSMLVLSSGHARIPGQNDACGSYLCSTLGAGTAPMGFPQNTPGCPSSSEINDDIGLELEIRTPTNATGYTFNFDFYTFEYDEWVCTSFNDQFIALVDPAPMGSINGNISFDSQTNPVSVNIAFFEVCSGCPLGATELQGTGFDGSWGDNAGATGWLQTQAPVEGGEDMKIRFAIWDTSDQSWDSTVLVDNFAWVAEPGVTVGTDPVPDPE